MNSNLFISCTLCSRTFLKYITAHHSLHKKPICKECYSKLISSTYAVKPIHTLSQPSCVNYTSLLSELCKLHNISKGLYCYTCNNSICNHCLNDHQSHNIVSLDSACKYTDKRLNWLISILNTNSKLNSCKPNSLKMLLKTLQNVTFSASSLTNSEWISKITRYINIFYQKLQIINSEYSKLSLESAFSLIKTESSLNILEIHSCYTWLEWGSSSLHIINLKNKEFRSQGLQKGFKIPYYCRSLLLPDGRIFMSGGRLYTDGISIHQAWILNTLTFEPKPIQNMIYGRSNHSLVHLNNYIYALGGCDQLNEFTDTCERYCMITKKWQEIQKALCVIDSACAVPIKHQNSIYVFGGREAYGVCISMIQRYDILRNRWVMLTTRLPEPRYLLGAIQIQPAGDKILIFGGMDEQRNPGLESYIFDYETHEIGSTSDCVSSLSSVNSSVVYKGSVISGEFKAFNLRSYQRYDITNRKWVSM